MGYKARTRVRLCRPAEGDCDEFLECVHRSKALHRSWVSPPADREDFLRYLHGLGERHVGFFLRRTSDDALVGVINLSEWVRGSFQSAYLGYYSFQPYQGSGLMTAGMQLVLSEAFCTLGIHRLEANIQPGNHASIALAKRCGFSREGFSPRYLKIAGRWRDHERWAVLSEDFLS